jgi:hypothetical protein
MSDFDIEKTTETLKESGSIMFFADYYSQLKNAFIVNVGDVPSKNGVVGVMNVRLESDGIMRALFIMDKDDPVTPGNIVFLASEEERDEITPEDFNGATIKQVMLATNPIPGKAVGEATVALNITNKKGQSFIVGIAGKQVQSEESPMTPGVILGLPIPRQ